MPQLLHFLSRFGVFRHVPMPTLRNYVILSVILMIGVLYHSYRTVYNDDEWNQQFPIHFEGEFFSPMLQAWLKNSVLFRVLYCSATVHQISTGVVVNSICCTVALLGCLLRWFVFGRLRAQETQMLRDRLWNFVSHKFVFVFGVLNATYMDEVAAWTFWFMAVGLIYLLTSLAQDRFKYMSSSAPATNVTIQYRLIVMTLCCCITSLFMLVIAGIGAAYSGAHYGFFLAAEAFILLISSIYCTFRYGVFLYDWGGMSTWEHRDTFMYYSEFTSEIMVDMVDLLHHLHMLVWGQIVLSMASLVMLMRIRGIYQEIDSRVRKHKNYHTITQHMNQHYPMATAEELAEIEEQCAICWDNMDAARKLPCGHLFHNWCLRGWLEQGASCPNCRAALVVAGQPPNAERNPVANISDIEFDARRRRSNHFFHFDGRRYAHWLPSFSVEVSHNLGAPQFFGIEQPVTDSQLTTMAEQVREMFPQVPLHMIMDDLRESGSSQATVESILEGRLAANSSAEESLTDIEERSASENVEDNDQTLSSATSTNDHSVYLREIIFGNRQNSASTTHQRANFDLPDEPSTSSKLSNPLTESMAVSLSTGVVVGSRFSKSSDEREMILTDRKRMLIDCHRRRYLASPRGENIRHLFSSDSSQSLSLSTEPKPIRRNVYSRPD